MCGIIAYVGKEQALPRLMNGLKLAEVDVNRKVLADMAINDAAGFTQLVDLAKTKLK